ncbi:hypothetical protein C5167_020620 [Papaver somniferum]|uniref:Uncharacterized protein n=1 Tax=Papaver somniferum TaxID=3469 RepID=A0A4Y7ITJ2_PAPSO|nr:hypothetical protein C5167_020620 [Papaver somniferum]
MKPPIGVAGLAQYDFDLPVTGLCLCTQPPMVMVVAITKEDARIDETNKFWLRRIILAYVEDISMKTEE